MENLAEPTTLIYEFEHVDNGAIFTEPATEMAKVYKRDEEKNKIGEMLYTDIDIYMEQNYCSAVSVKIIIEEIKPKYYYGRRL